MIRLFQYRGSFSLLIQHTATLRDHLQPALCFCTVSHAPVRAKYKQYITQKSGGTIQESTNERTYVWRYREQELLQNKHRQRARNKNVLHSDVLVLLLMSPGFRLPLTRSGCKTITASPFPGGSGAADFFSSSFFDSNSVRRVAVVAVVAIHAPVPLCLSLSLTSFAFYTIIRLVSSDPIRSDPRTIYSLKFAHRMRATKRARSWCCC